MDNSSRVTGWWVFAGILLFVAGALNIIYGIAALGNSKFFTENVTLIATDLNTWGWVTIVLGVIQLTAGISLFAGGGWGRFVGIVAAMLNAIVALVTIPASPFWSLCVFILSVVIMYELAKTPENA
jgi:uncharacterized membrane protein